MEYTDLYFTGFVLKVPVIVAPKPSFKEAIQQNYTNALLKWNAPESYKIYAAISGKAYRYVDCMLFSQRRLFNDTYIFKSICRVGYVQIIPHFLHSTNNLTKMLEAGLHGACGGGNLALVQQLESLGAEYDPNILLIHSHHFDLFLYFAQQCNVDFRKSEYYMWACRSGDERFISYCINNGCSNWRAGMSGAIFGGHLAIAKKILKDNSITLSATDLDEYLYDASRTNRYNIALWLLESDFEVKHSKTLRCVCKFCWMNIVDTLVARGCTKEQLYHGFLGACESGNKSLIEYLADLL
jgi:hypothetical protein